MDWSLVIAFCNAFGVLLIGVAMLIGSEAMRLLAGWKTDETVAALRRRLADVEALRARQAMPGPLIRKHLGDDPFGNPPLDRTQDCGNVPGAHPAQGD